MKFFLLIVLCSITLFSCELLIECDTPDWIGTYKGLMDCGGIFDSITVTIEEDSTGGILVTTDDGQQHSLDPVVCNFSIEGTDWTGPITTTYYLDGGDLEMVRVGEIADESFECTAILIIQ